MPLKIETNHPQLNYKIVLNQVPVVTGLGHTYYHFKLQIVVAICILSAYSLYNVWFYSLQFVHKTYATQHIASATQHMAYATQCITHMKSIKRAASSFSIFKIILK
jgi:hypothetical protein